MVWNGFDAYSEVDKIIGIRNRSVCLATPDVATQFREQHNQEYNDLTHNARFLCDLLTGAPLLSPMRPR